MRQEATHNNFPITGTINIFTSINFLISHSLPQEDIHMVMWIFSSILYASGHACLSCTQTLPFFLLCPFQSTELTTLQYLRNNRVNVPFTIFSFLYFPVYLLFIRKYFRKYFIWKEEFRKKIKNWKRSKENNCLEIYVHFYAFVSFYHFDYVVSLFKHENTLDNY